MPLTYTLEITIDKTRAEVVELFDSVENLYKWQPELQKYEHISGEPGKPGAKARLSYKFGKRDYEMIETMAVNNLPDEMHGSYEMGGTLNEIQNYFSETPDGKTIYRIDNTFHLKGFMKFMAWIYPGMFKKQTMKFLKRFKDFCEGRPVT